MYSLENGNIYIGNLFPFLIMKKNLWRKNIDLSIRDHLEAQINETGRYRNSYKLAKNPAEAQLWCAIANLSKQIFDLHLKMNYLERALKDTLQRKKDNNLRKALKKL